MFDVYEDEKTVAFFDGPNFYAACREANFEVDYKKLLKMLQESSRFIRAYYYTAMPEDPEVYSPIRPLADFLSYNGYTMVTKNFKTMTDQEGRIRHKGNMDVEIAVDMLQLSDKVDHIILFSGDGDFRHLVEAVQKKGVRVTIVSYIGETNHPMIADELRRQADDYVDISELKNLISREPREPREPRVDNRARFDTTPRGE